MLKITYFVLLSVSASLCQDSEVVIEIYQGLIRGYLQFNGSGEGETFYSFVGIPYIRPPLGELRFKDPVDPLPWDGVYDAQNWPQNCIQGDDEGSGVEDCVYLTVFTPELPGDGVELKPVLVYYHGGSFVAGNGYIGPNWVVAEGIVVVTLNYRLNVFGFLSTLDEAAEGNAGLKDCVAALGWIQRNIASFGGDPSRVTVMGESAGAGVVQYLLQTPLTDGLFHQAIAHSGSSLNRWSFQRYPLTSLEHLAYGLGVNLEGRSSDDVVRELQNLDTLTVYNALIDYDIMGPDRILEAQPFVPIIERDHSGAFLTESSYQALQLGHYQKVPCIFGYNSGDGSLASPIDSYSVDIPRYNEDHSLLAPLAMNLQVGSEAAQEVGARVWNFYFNNQTLEENDDLIIFFTDEQFARGIRLTVETMKTQVPVYVYKFFYKGSNSWGGPEVSHGEELGYLFCCNNENATDRLVRQRMVRMWTNFIKGGDPTPDDDPLIGGLRWLPALDEETDRTRFLTINAEFEATYDVDQERYDFWTALFDEYGIPPYYIY